MATRETRVYRAGCLYFKTEMPTGDLAYRHTSNIWRTLVDNIIVVRLDVVGASPFGAAPSTSSYSA